MLDQAAIDFLENRGLDIEAATRLGISTDPKLKSFANNQSVLVFPYVEDGVLVNEKFRMLPKEKFWQHRGRRKILWNVDCLDDPLVESGNAVVITEGELDALAVIQCGFPLCVSVPDGAPPASPHDIEHDSGEQGGRYEFLWNSQAKLNRVKRFILAVDADGPGQRLREELMRHLRAARCSFIEYPIGCKDLNDVLAYHGQSKLVEILNNAKPCPVNGIFKISDYPDNGPLRTFTSGWPLLDNHFRPFMGEFIVVTGIPQHGKSSWTLQLLAQMAKNHGLRSAIFSPEMKIVPVIRDRLCSIRDSHTSPHSPETWAWVEDMFTFIGRDPRGTSYDDDDFTLEYIIEKAQDAVLRDGIRFLLVDPWNEIEHAKEKNETLTEYVARGIRLLKRFAMTYNVTVIVVAHPTKMGKNKDGMLETPGLYDISDSAAWYNKADHGVVIWRDFEANCTEVHIVKSRFDEAGEPGVVKMHFDRQTHRFEPLSFPA